MPLYVQASANPSTFTQGGSADLGGSRMIDTAVAGVAAASAPLPYRERIQAAFGAHDIGHVRAAVGGEAGEAAARMGARAYAVGDRVAFTGDPDLRLAAHEAAHIVQQRAGVQLEGGVGKPGDEHERAADAAAAAVVEGHSAEHLLVPVHRATRGAGVQMACDCGTCGTCAARQVTPVVQLDLEPSTVVQTTPAGRSDTDPSGSQSTTPSPNIADPVGWDPDRDTDEAVPDDTMELEQTELQQGLGWRAGPMPVDLHPDEPTVLVVPMDATYEEVAEALTGNKASRTDWFDFMAPTTQPMPPENKKCVQVMDPSWVTRELRGRVQEALEQLLPKDVIWTVGSLKARFPDDGPIVRRVLGWSQRSSWPDASGASYFDRFLDALDQVELEQPHWYTLTLTSTTKSALEWVLDDLKDAEPVKKAIALRSNRTIDYEVDDTTPVLKAGDVVGRMYFNGGDHLRVYVAEHIAEMLTMAAAIICAENATNDNATDEDMRIVMPRPRRARLGGPQYYDAYSAIMDPALGEIGDDTEFYFYYPGTVILGRWSSMTRKGDSSDESLRDDIGAAALAQSSASDPKPLYGLDHDVLARLDARSRMLALQDVTGGGGIDDGNGMLLLSRLVATTPAKEFPAIEQALVARSMVDRLARSEAGIEARMALGQAFTLKSIELYPSSLGELPEEPAFRIGQTGSWTSTTKQWVDVETSEVQSRAIAQGEWPDEAAIKLGQEPAAPDEATHDVSSTGISFTQVSRTRAMKYIYRGDVGPEEQGAKSHAYAPSELVVVELEGHDPRQQVMSAFELALVRGDADKFGAMDWVNLAATYIGAAGIVRGLGRSLGAGLIRGLAQASLRAALAEGVSAFAQAASRTALRGAVAEMLLLQGFNFVETSRFELEETAAGRAFLAVFDVASLILATHGIRKLWASGALQRLAKLSVAMLNDLAISGKTATIELVDTMRAWGQAFSKWRPLAREARELVAEGGLTLGKLSPEESVGLLSLYREARAEIYGQRVLDTLGAGKLPTDTATALFDELKQAAKSFSGEPKDNVAARAWGAITRRAARMEPSQIESFLSEAKKLLGQRADTTALGDFLVAASRIDEPGQALGVLRQAQALAERAGIADDTLRTLGAKAARGSVDLEWLSSLSLSDELLNFLGRDKMTPWRLFRAAATSTMPLWSDILKARAARRIRGAAGELLAERNIEELFGGKYRISGRQVYMRGSILDYGLESTTGGGGTRALEVKAWQGTLWDAVVEAVELRPQDRTMQQEKLADMFEHLVRQLQNATRETGGRSPFLLTNMSELTLAAVMDIFKQRKLIVNVKRYSEASLDAIIGELSKGLGIQ